MIVLVTNAVWTTKIKYEYQIELRVEFNDFPHYLAVVMEDLKGYSILRAELIEGCVEIAAIQEVMSSIGAIHRQSLHKNLSTEKWQELVALSSGM